MDLVHGIILQTTIVGCGQIRQMRTVLRRVQVSFSSQVSQASANIFL